MEKYLFSKRLEIDNSNSNVDVNLLLVHFTDENNIQFIYSPHLDLTGYDTNLEGAKSSFKIALQEFFDFTIENNTLENVLNKLGWRLNNKQPQQIETKMFSDILKENDYVSEILNKYPVHTFYQNVGIPVAHNF